MPNSRARTLRNNLTHAERRLWRLLRRRQMAGCRFRRQAPIGRYIVDFACFDPRLVIEVDGGQHSEALEYDAARARWLESQEFLVLRFWNNEVLGNLEGAGEVIRQELENLMLPSPPP